MQNRRSRAYEHHHMHRHTERAAGRAENDHFRRAAAPQSAVPKALRNASVEQRIEARRRQWRASARRWNDASLQQQPEVAAAAARAVRGTAAADSVRSAVLAAASPGRFLLPPGRVRSQVAWTLLRPRLRRLTHGLRRLRPRATKLASDDRVSRQRLADAYESITVQRQRAARSSPHPRVQLREGWKNVPDAFLLRGPKKVSRGANAK